LILAKSDKSSYVFSYILTSTSASREVAKLPLRRSVVPLVSNPDDLTTLSATTPEAITAPARTAVLREEENII